MQLGVMEAIRGGSTGRWCVANVPAKMMISDGGGGGGGGGGCCGWSRGRQGVGGGGGRLMKPPFTKVFRVNGCKIVIK